MAGARGRGYPRVMLEGHTNAEEMARQAGLPNGKLFRLRLHRRHPELHIHGRWEVAIGSAAHRLMLRELDDMLNRRAGA